jgi:mannose-1-phosphate guanylyltransferase
LLGSAGTLVANRQWVDGEELFLACNADNLTDFDLRSLVDAHLEHGAIATLTVFHSPNPSAGGVVDIDAADRVIGFEEKPSQPVSDLTNAGMYAFHPSVLDEIDATPPNDIGYDLLPRLVGRARAVPVEGYFRDIGTADAYRLAREEWPVRAGR